MAKTPKLFVNDMLILETGSWEIEGQLCKL